MNRSLSLTIAVLITVCLLPFQLSAQQKKLPQRPGKIITIRDLKCNIEITGIVTDVSCYGDYTGAIDITVKGTKGMVSYLWNDGSTSEDRTGLAAGTYTVTVKDETKRKTSASFTVTQPDEPLTVEPRIRQPSSPGSCDGGVALSISGGNPLYITTWDDGYTGSCRTDLCPGTYRVCVTDSNGCTVNTKITLKAPSNVIGAATDLSSLMLGETRSAVASPNPARGAVQLSMSAKTNGTAVINIYDMGGKRLSTEKSGVTQGTNIKSIDLGKYAKGIYHVEMIVEGQKKMVKVLVQ